MSDNNRAASSRSGGALVVACLKALGVRHTFGVPGESYLPILDALHDTKGAVDFTLCRHEGGAAFMAAAYGKLTGSPGICLVTRGPGATNAAIGVHTARQDSAPMILLVGQVGTEMAAREAFQEVDYKAMFGSVAKWAVEVSDPDRLPEVLMRAWAIATQGRPGPVVVALPEDVLSTQTTAPPLRGPVDIRQPAPSGSDIEELRAQISRATRPVLLVGGGGWTAADRAALDRMARASRIPVVAAFRYQDLCDTTSPVYAGEAGVAMPPHVRTLLVESDMIVAVGARLSEMTTDGYTVLRSPEPDQTLIHVHRDVAEIGKIYRPDIGIVSGPAAFLDGLGFVAGSWDAWCTEAREAYLQGLAVPPQPSPVDMAEVVSHLRSVLPPDVIVTNGAGNFTVWPNKYLSYGPNARLLAPQSGAMGYGLPAAIAAKTVYPDREVVCFAGDGDLSMTMAELATAVQSGAAPIILVLNNGTYGTIRAHQERAYPGRVSGTTLENPDFAAIARAHGMHGERVSCTEEFPDAFERARASGTGALLDLAISVEALTPLRTLEQIRGGAAS